MYREWRQLTNTHSRPIAERHVFERGLVIVVLEPLRVECLGVWVVLGVHVCRVHRDGDPLSCLQSDVSAWQSVWRCHNSIQHW